MRTIYKFQLTAENIPMPAMAEVKYFAMQHGIPTIWAIVDTEAPKEIRTFKIFGTGHQLPPETDKVFTSQYIGSTQDGPFVWHLFEMLGEKVS